jgi:hypothetical protein
MHVGREYSALGTVMANLPYVAMVVLGAIIIALGLPSYSWAWAAAGAYAAYGLLGVLWIILFLCPYCPSYAEQSCPCGYGAIAARLRPKGNTALFARKFKQHIPVIVPLWFIPPLIGGALIVKSFSWPLAVLLGVFVLDSFVLIPLLSKSHGCKGCPQREACPWMGG